MTDFINRAELINQLRVTLSPEEFSQLDLENATDAQLQAKLTQALNNNALWENFDGFQRETVVPEAENTQPETEDAQLTQLTDVHTDADGNEVTELYMGAKLKENLVQSIIRHVEENETVVETVIIYKAGKVFSKTVKNLKDNTETFTTYDDEEFPKKETVVKDGKEIKTIEYKTEDDDPNYGRVVVIDENNFAEGKKTSRIVTRATKIDKNGKWDDEDFRQREIFEYGVGKYSVRIAEDGNLRELRNDKDGIVLINYDGNSITAFDNNELAETGRELVAEANPNATVYGEAVVAPLATSPLQRSLGQVFAHMDKVVSGNTPEQFKYDKKVFAELFSELEKPNCKYKKISDNPLRYEIKNVDGDGVELFNHEFYVGKDLVRIHHVGGDFREKRDGDEYVIFMSDDRVSKSYRFNLNGTLKCVSITQKDSPNVETDYYPDGSSREYVSDEMGRVVTDYACDKNRQLLLIQEHQYDGFGNLERVVKRYTSNELNKENKNKMYIIRDSGEVAKEDDETSIPADVLEFEYVPLDEYKPQSMDHQMNIPATVKDKDGNEVVQGYYVYKSMRIPQTVPVERDGEVIGSQLVTTMTIDRHGYIVGQKQYRGINRGLELNERCNTAEFDMQSKIIGTSTIINHLENIKSVLDNAESNRSIIDASAWINGITKLCGGNSTADNSKIIQKYINLAEALGLYAKDEYYHDEDNAYQNLVRCMEDLYNSVPEVARRFNSYCNFSDGETPKFDLSRISMKGFDLGYYMLTGRMFFDHREQYVSFGQKETAAENNLRVLYEKYDNWSKNKGESTEPFKITPKEKELFRDISGSREDTWQADFMNFIKEVQQLREAGCPEENLFISTSVARKYLAGMTSGILKRSGLTSEMKDIQDSEHNKETIGTMLDLAAMALEFGVIAKGINYGIKLGKGLMLAKSTRIMRFATATGEFLSSESNLAKVLNYAKNVTSRVSLSGTNFATYDMLHEAGRMVYNDESLLDWSNIKKIGHKGLIGFELGTLAAGISTFVSEPIVRFIKGSSSLNVAEVVGEKLGANATKSVKATELADALTKARAAAYQANPATFRGMMSKGVGFGLEVLSFTGASMAVNMFDPYEIREQLIAAGLDPEKVETMSRDKMIEEMLKLQGIDTTGMSDSEKMAAYVGNEVKNQFIGIGKLKVTEQVLGMFLTKGHLPIGTAYGKRTKSLEFIPDGKGHFYAKGDPAKTPLPEEVIASRVQQAMVFDALDAKFQNRFNNYRNKPMSGKEFTEMIYGKSQNGESEETGTLADKMTVVPKDGKYEVTTSNGKKVTVDNVDGVLSIYMEELMHEQIVKATEQYLASMRASEGHNTDSDYANLVSTSFAPVPYWPASNTPVANSPQPETGSSAAINEGIIAGVSASVPGKESEGISAIVEKLSKSAKGISYDDFMSGMSKTHIGGDVYTRPDGSKVVKVEAEVHVFTKTKYDSYEFDANGNLVEMSQGLTSRGFKQKYPDLNGARSTQFRFVAGKTEGVLGATFIPGVGVGSGSHNHAAYNSFRDGLMNPNNAPTTLDEYREMGLKLCVNQDGTKNMTAENLLRDIELLKIDSLDYETRFKLLEGLLNLSKRGNNFSELQLSNFRYMLIHTRSRFNSDAEGMKEIFELFVKTYPNLDNAGVFYQIVMNDLASNKSGTEILYSLKAGIEPVGGNLMHFNSTKYTASTYDIHPVGIDKSPEVHANSRVSDNHLITMEQARQICSDESLIKLATNSDGQIDKNALELSMKIKDLNIDDSDTEFLLEQCNGDYKKVNDLIEKIKSDLDKLDLEIRYGRVWIKGLERGKYPADMNAHQLVEKYGPYCGFGRDSKLLNGSYSMEYLMEFYLFGKGKYIDSFYSGDIMRDLDVAYGCRTATRQYAVRYTSIGANEDKIANLMEHALSSTPTHDQRYALGCFKGDMSDLIQERRLEKEGNDIEEFLSGNPLKESIKVKREDSYAILCNFKFADGVTLKEALTNPQYYDRLAQIKSLEGQSFINDRFMSTTVSEKAFGNCNVNWDLEICDGVGATYLDIFGLASEGELLLNRGLKITIIEIEETTPNGIVNIKARVSKA